jgi:hypothetical protein
MLEAGRVTGVARLALACCGVGLSLCGMALLVIAYVDGFSWLLGDPEGPLSQYVVRGGTWLAAGVIAICAGLALLGRSLRHKGH